MSLAVFLTGAPAPRPPRGAGEGRQAGASYECAAGTGRGGSGRGCSGEESWGVGGGTRQQSRAGVGGGGRFGEKNVGGDTGAGVLRPTTKPSYAQRNIKSKKSQELA